MFKQRFAELADHELFSTCRRSTLAQIDRLGYPLDVEAGRVLGCSKSARQAERPLCCARVHGSARRRFSMTAFAARP